MHHITMYLDFVSPYAWLEFQQLPPTLQGLSWHVEYRPVLLGELLQQNSNTGTDEYTSADTSPDRWGDYPWRRCEV